MSLTRTSKRLVSLDVLRGITVCGMILVNNAGACGYAYAPLKHAKWDGFTPADESQINSRDYIDGYEVQNVYAKKGLTDDSYVVYVVFNYICTGIETPVPALSQFYVETGSDGNLKIKGGADDDADISAYVKKLESEKDVQELITKVKTDYEAAQESDPSLAEFLQGLGEDASASADAGTMLTVTEDCNVRAAASSDAEILGGLSAGTEVEKKGEDGEWVQIDYDGTEAYVHNSLLQEKTE